MHDPSGRPRWAWSSHHGLTRFLLGVTTLCTCLAPVAITAATLQPDLSALPSHDRIMIESACNTQRLVSGPGAYYACLSRQVEALKQSPRSPDLAGVVPAERDMISSACNTQRLVSGPAAYYQCLNRQVEALEAVTSGP